VTIGPLELVVLGFEGNNFKGEIAAAIEEAVATGAIRVIDLVAVRKDPDGNVVALEVEDVGEAVSRDFRELEGNLHDLLTEEDAITIARMLPVNTAALVALIEHTWAIKIKEAIQRAGGQLLATQRLSARLVEGVREQIEAELAAPARAR
jgi:uncharacterized membrane protein